MSELTIFIIVWGITAVIWIIVLAIYSAWIESFDFGVLTTFAGKSTIIITAVTAVLIYVPWGGLLSLVVWWIGLAVLFKMDVWECKYLVFLLWAVRFLVFWMLQTALLANR